LNEKFHGKILLLSVPVALFFGLFWRLACALSRKPPVALLNEFNPGSPSCVVRVRQIRRKPAAVAVKPALLIGVPALGVAIKIIGVLVLPITTDEFLAATDADQSRRRSRVSRM
jgi:hypothetical protein